MEPNRLPILVQDGREPCAGRTRQDGGQVKPEAVNMILWKAQQQEACNLTQGPCTQQTGSTESEWKGYHPCLRKCCWGAPSGSAKPFRPFSCSKATLAALQLISLCSAYLNATASCSAATVCAQDRQAICAGSRGMALQSWHLGAASYLAKYTRVGAGFATSKSSPAALPPHPSLFLAPPVTQYFRQSTMNWRTAGWLQFNVLPQPL